LRQGALPIKTFRFEFFNVVVELRLTDREKGGLDRVSTGTPADAILAGALCRGRKAIFSILPSAALLFLRNRILHPYYGDVVRRPLGNKKQNSADESSWHWIRPPGYCTTIFPFMNG
jgi:hypothetical protein